MPARYLNNHAVTRWLDELRARADADPALAEIVRLLSAGDGEAARARAEAVTAARPDDADAWYLLGLACAETGALGASLAACDRCIDLAPDFPDAHFGRGCAFEAMRRDDLAAAAYGDAITRDPTFTRAWINLTLACLRAGELASALAATGAAFAAGVDDPVLRYKRAEALARAGRTDDAVAELERAIALDPAAAAEIADDEVFAAALDAATLARLAALG